MLQSNYNFDPIMDTDSIYYFYNSKHYFYFINNKPIARFSINDRNYGKDRLYIWDVFVDPAYRGRGICKYMLSQVMNLYSKCTFYLLVNSLNTSAQKCYFETGFKHVGNSTNNINGELYLQMILHKS
jgi:ribosomal protein S18 acetylase RimI-like enzyme